MQLNNTFFYISILTHIYMYFILHTYRYVYIHTYIRINTYIYIFPLISISSTFPSAPVRNTELKFLGFDKRKLHLSSLNPLLQRISFYHTSSLCLLSFQTIFRTQAVYKQSLHCNRPERQQWLSTWLCHCYP